MLQDPENIDDFCYEISVPFNSDYKVMEAEAWKICREEFVSDGMTQIIGVEQKTRILTGAAM
ncbi:MAG: hypothetical protein HC866_24370 [Leptolyngbyaceae cyanobacterium RU_5_1]|nr:hypothetical protein [Leptolyngbyaceae cyanobacterium RU_5_1]